METRLRSATKEVIIGDGRPTVLIGERINPTGKKRMSEALRAGDLAVVREEALAQVQAGADVIDVNVATPGVDEVNLLPRVVKLVQETVDVPLCIDSPNPEALAAALKVYKGRPLVNSVTGEEHSLARVLNLVKEYGAAVVGLVQDEDGAPKDAARRLTIARKIIARAEAMGILRQDVVIDCLAFAIAADARSGLTIFETIRGLKAELGVNLTMGASNVSFGLPDRSLINNTFVAMVIGAGANALIVDAARVRPTVLAADLVLGRDEYARRYIKAFRERQKALESKGDQA
jgi:5-methyltetrahydrofolate--homocysteine methyltransferase